MAARTSWASASVLQCTMASSAYLSHAGPVDHSPLALALSASVRCREPSTVPWHVSSPPVSADLAGCYRKTLRHTTHLKDLPKHATITRPHHPLEGKTLLIFGVRRFQGELNLMLILPNGSRSLIPAEWTDLS